MADDEIHAPHPGCIKDKLPPVPVSANASTERYHTVKVEQAFRARPQDIWDALTNDTVMSGYTNSMCQFANRVGASYSLLDGNVIGTIKALAPPSYLELTWRFNEWREQDVSTVKISLTQVAEDVTRVMVVQSGVPCHDSFGAFNQEQKVERGWKERIFHPIHHVLGYGHYP